MASDPGVDATMASTGASKKSPSVTIRAGAKDYEALVEISSTHYVVGKELARGGMGRIVTARDRRLGRTVAIKELLSNSPSSRMRFEREARITAKLQHPAIINILEAGVWPNGEPFYVMKLVSGEALDAVLAKRPLLADRLALLPHIIAVVDALAYAHDKRVIHRDLKPSNVLIGDFGETVVIDWGLAKDLSVEEDDLEAGPFRQVDDGQTVAGSVMGTPAYMPIEQAMGEPVDARADVYALGALLYQVLGGGAPYEGKTSQAILEAVISGPPTPLARRMDGIPADLVTIVEKAMQREPEGRYPSAKELAEDLKRFQTGQLVGAHRYSTRQLLARWLRRNRAAVLVASVLLSILVVGGVFSVSKIVSQRDTARELQATAERARTDADLKRAEADRRRLAAQHLVDYILVELRDQLAPIGKLGVLQGVGDAVLAYLAAADVDDAVATHEDRRNHAAALNLVAATQVEKMKLDVALATYQAAEAMTTKLLDARPDDREAKELLSRSLEGQVIVLQKEGKAVELAAVADRWKTTLDRFIATAPNEPMWQAALGSRTQKLAAAASLAARHADAEALAREAITHLAKASELAPTSAEYKLSLANANYLTGFSANAQYKLDVGIPFLRAATGITEELVRVSPDDAIYLARHGTFLQALGTALVYVQRQAEARTVMGTAVAILAKLVAKDPENASWADQLASTYAAMADLDVATNQCRSAVANVQLGLDAFARVSPTSTERKTHHTRAWLYGILAQCEARVTTKRDERLQVALENAVSELSAWQEGDIAIERVLQMGMYDRVGLALHARGLDALARKYYELGIARLEPAARTEPSAYNVAAVLEAAYTHLLEVIAKDDLAVRATLDKYLALAESFTTHASQHPDEAKLVMAGALIARANAAITNLDDRRQSAERARAILVALHEANKLAPENVPEIAKLDALLKTLPR